MCVAMLATTADAQTTEFTYQGKLTDAGPTSPTYDFEFRLFDADAKGTELATIQRMAVPISGGVFSVRLDFGSAVFDGSPRWLEIAVKRPADANFATLSPRQPLTSSPYALRSFSSFTADNLGGIGASNYLLTNGDGSGLANVAKLDSPNAFTGADNSFPQITLTGEGQIIGSRLENSPKDPAPASAANAGRVYFNTNSNTVRISDGTNWVSLTNGNTPQRQTFAGVTARTLIGCGTFPDPIRTAAFTKNSADTRLRVIYRDSAFGTNSTSFTMSVSARVDGALITNPTALRMTFASTGGSGIFVSQSAFTMIGYIDGIGAGVHTLTFTYSTTSISGSPGCFRDQEPFLIEIEEVP